MYAQNILNNAVGVIFSVHSGEDGKKGGKAVVNDPLGAIYSLLPPPPPPQQLLHLENKAETPPISTPISLLGFGIFLGKVFEVREPLEK